MPVVHVIGGGMAGLSVAHELARFREDVDGVAFEVHVYDRADRFGGKSDTQFHAWDGGQLPGEHGFRYFPHFYRCIVRTMEEIPFPDDYAASIGWRPSRDGTVRGLLQDATQGAIAYGGRLVVLERTARPGPAEMVAMMRRVGMNEADLLAYMREIVRFITSCDARQLAEWEHRTLDDVFDLHGDTYSPEFKAYVRSLRGLSAMRADTGSARSTLTGTVQLMWNFDLFNEGVDQLLVGPTEYLFVRPWLRHLGEQGVSFHPEHTLTALSFDPFGLEHATLEGPDGPVRLETDEDTFVVCAVPMEAIHPLLHDAGTLNAPMQAFAEIPLDQAVQPMTGVQFFLRRDVPVCHGHVHYVDSPWALTSVSQGQFWRLGLATGTLAERFGVPELEGILSAIVSAWDEPGMFTSHRARDCTAEEVIAEVWAQLRTFLVDDDGAPLLRDEDLITARMDRRMVFGPGAATSDSPLFVSPAGTFMQRPPARTGLSHFYLASDYVRQETDLASMEGANEAARWAVRALLDEVDAAIDPDMYPVVPPLRLWAFADLARRVDRYLYRLHLPHILELGPLDLLRALRRLPDAMMPDLAADDLEDELFAEHALRSMDSQAVDAMALLGRMVRFLVRRPYADWTLDQAQAFLELIRRE